MKVILDTNIFFSALITPYGLADAIYRAWRAAVFELVTSKDQLDEIRRASKYPKLRSILQPAKVGTMLNNLQRALILEDLKVTIEANDPNDSYLLAMALEAKADYLVTGDHKAGMLKLGKIGQTKIVTPKVFCEKYCTVSEYIS